MRLVLISAGAAALAACASDGGSGRTGGAKPLACGVASYYADSLAGNATASGANYDPKKLTAAHKELSFGTSLRVVRADDGRSVNVTVNDRGPYSGGRIIDLSRAAAERIGLVQDGVTEVCIFAR